MAAAPEKPFLSPTSPESPYTKESFNSHEEAIDDDMERLAYASTIDKAISLLSCTSIYH